MMRIIFFLFLLFAGSTAFAQFHIPAYTIVHDSTTRTTVIHIGNAAKLKLSARPYTSTLLLISPAEKIKNGIVDHKGMTGEILVRVFYADSIMIGYIEYDGQDMQRELYFNGGGKVFLEKRYDKGALIYMNDKVQTFVIKNE
jgi:hypothetical protein